MLEISNNSTSIYRSCPKKYYWRYIKGLTPFKKSSALTLGSIIHSAFDMYYNNFTEDEVSKFIGRTADEEIAKSPPDTSEDMAIMKYTLLGMWMNYPKDLSVFTDIKPEMKLKFELEKGVIVVLKIDGLVTHDGKMWIRELKTTGLSFSQFEQRCRTSPQASLYTYALQRLGYPVEGVIYDFIKKPQLRKNVNEDKDQFGYRIMSSYKERPDFYFKRHYAYRSNEDLGLFKDDIVAVARDLQKRCKTNDWYRNADSCWTFNSACPYLPICFQKVPDTLTMQVFFKQEEINPEKGDERDE